MNYVVSQISHPGVELRANLKSIAPKCHLFEVAFVWELPQETIHLPLGCLQDGYPDGDIQLETVASKSSCPCKGFSEGVSEEGRP